jgi:hypothetical protein
MLFMQNIMSTQLTKTEVQKPDFHPEVQALEVRVVFGNPGMACAGTGICRLGLEDMFEKQKIGCRSAPARVLSIDPGKLHFFFPKERACRSCMERHFGAGFFVNERATPIPPAIRTRLCIGPGNISPGRYRVLETAEHYLLVVALTAPTRASDREPKKAGGHRCGKPVSRQ